MIRHFLPGVGYFTFLYSLVLFSFFCFQNFPCFYDADTRGEENFPSKMGKIGIRETNG